MSVTSVRLSPQNEEIVTQVATKLRRSKSWVINEAIGVLHQQQLQAEERWQDTLEALQHAQAGETYSGEAVHAWLSSWGTADERKAPNTAP